MAANDYPTDRLAERSVLVVGVGALGCPAAELLVRAGVGRLTLIDPDVVELSNLQRQVLFSDADLAAPKATAARRALLELDPTASVIGVAGRFDAGCGAGLVREHDFVIDACDDPATKLLINATAVAERTPYAYGGVARTGGSAMRVRPYDSACLQCAFPELGADLGGREPAACSELGILAPVAGVIGALLARHALVELCGGDPRDAGVMTRYDVRGRRWHRTRLSRSSSCAACAPIADRASAPTRRSEPCHS